MAAGAGFESNPFRWKLAKGAGRLSQADITFSWEWWEGGAWRREIVAPYAHHLAAHTRGVPTPVGLQNDDEKLHRRLLAAAESIHKVPCEYLGKKIGNGQFEPDPARWLPGSDPEGRKSHEEVWYEWKHVTRGDLQEPHRVRVRAHKVLRRGSGVPQDPLAHSGPTNLWFSVEFMKDFAEQRWPGTLYTGISYETGDGRSRSRSAIHILYHRRTFLQQER